MQNGRFLSKSAFLSKKVGYKVSLCENHQREKCKHLLAYLSVQKWLVEEVPFYLKIKM